MCLLWYTTIYRSLLIPIIINCKQATKQSFTSSDRRVCAMTTSLRRKIASSINSTPKTNTFGNCELDSHADSIVAGSNCVILTYSGKECDVSPYREDYETIKNVPIVTAATAWQSPITGQTYILVFNEAIWMGDHMNHTLLNPNQLRHYGVRVQDDPTSHFPLAIATEDKRFCMELQMSGTIIYAPTYTPTDNDLKNHPHIELSSPHQWDPKRVKFPKCTHTLGEFLGDHSRQLSSVITSDQQALNTIMRSLVLTDSNIKFHLYHKSK